MQKIKLLKLKNTPIIDQLAMEEALLRTCDQNYCVISHGTKPAIVMGISGKPELLIEEQNPYPVIRRFSGGGTVLVDENTFFISLICNSLKDIPSYPAHILKWTSALYAPLFQENQFNLKENDYALGNKKFGGNAQYIVKNRWLHHSSLLWDYNLEAMQVLKIPERAPDYRQNRSHSDFLCPLKPHFSSKEHFESLFLKELARHFTIEDITQDQLDLKKFHRKTTTLL
jgi:lipoate-protein ligase A